MSVLLPFRALRDLNPAKHLFVSGEESDPPFHPELLTEDSQPALFLYRQRFHGFVRDGVIGILKRAEARPDALFGGRTAPFRRRPHHGCTHQS